MLFISQGLNVWETTDNSSEVIGKVPADVLTPGFDLIVKSERPDLVSNLLPVSNCANESMSRVPVAIRGALTSITILASAFCSYLDVFSYLAIA